jgi:hypothetical protein
MKVLWPFGVALRGEASNRLKLRWLKTVVVSVEEKACVTRQVGIGKANASEPLLKCRNDVDDIETGETKSFRDESGGCPGIGQVVSGMKAARVRSAASAGNVGRRATTLPPVGWVARGSVPRLKP